jgi:hypothetical protein
MAFVAGGYSMAAEAEGVVVVRADVVVPCSTDHYVKVFLAALSAAFAGTSRLLKLRRKKKGRR